MDFLFYSAAFVVAVLIVLMLQRRSLHLPPGPKGLPIIGNLFDFGGDALYVKARDWSKEYGDDVISLTTLGHTTVILNSAQAVADLYVSRGANYSDRPDMPMLIDLVGWDWTFALMRYGPRWKEHRRVFHNEFDATIKEHRVIQVPAAHELVRLLLSDRTPKKFLDHLEHYTARIIMQRVYGYTFEDAMKDPFVLVNKAASETTSTATVPGTFLVDTFPILKYVPEWMPGAGFKKIAREWRILQEAVVNRPFDMVRDQHTKGIAKPCFVGSCLEDRTNAASKSLDEDVIKSIAAVVYAAGSDTNLATLTSFVLAMVLHPEVQKRIQTELDSVLGGERLPTFEDKEHLPYFWNVMREVLRWLVVFPFAIPHRAMSADTYKGFHIPANATILGNTWAIMHNPDVYPDPETFKPERHEAEGVRDPIECGVFGYGRRQVGTIAGVKSILISSSSIRSCSGKNMALDTVWIAMATILTVFNIKKAVDEKGNIITPAIEFRRSTINHPAPFDCTFEPRSAAALALIHQTQD
ncbi:cytochrome P450 monooxygenase 37 [Heterobasidion irregulare TC 32-1]|uniref:Cytochrome P450 monooxygenase 37 n=1 Tax=Heterobasidion irregulare (strain TC 32-1) TaxID=747525 RepID=W4K2I6_HETIT|nr:cytochrome P450 monooxygenase 37 [Heterobasidion irregulare TC 32-1]ETW79565.1 cytochrome P450 monooxygenase 37 [Heterobasidion irregulare TC 32-1]